MENLIEILNKYSIPVLTNVIINYYTGNSIFPKEAIEENDEYLYLLLANYSRDGNAIMVKYMLETYGKEQIKELYYALTQTFYPVIITMLIEEDPTMIDDEMIIR